MVRLKGWRDQGGCSDEGFRQPQLRPEFKGENVEMRHKLVMVVLAAARPVGMLLATETMASAQKASGGPVNATGTLACSKVAGNIKLSPGWRTSASNTISSPSTATFRVAYSGCTATGGNMTTKVFGAHLRGSVIFPTDYCSTNLGGTVALQHGTALPITWNSQARVGPVTPSPTDLTLASVTGAITAGSGVTLTFSHQAVTGSFSAKTLSGQFQSGLDICSPNVGIKNIPVTGGYLTQP